MDLPPKFISPPPKKKVSRREVRDHARCLFFLSLCTFAPRFACGQGTTSMDRVKLRAAERTKRKKLQDASPGSSASAGADTGGGGLSDDGGAGKGSAGGSLVDEVFGGYRSVSGRPQSHWLCPTKPRLPPALESGIMGSGGDCGEGEGDDNASDDTGIGGGGRGGGSGVGNASTEALWVAVKNATGAACYLDEATGSTSWEVPEAILKSASACVRAHISHERAVRNTWHLPLLGVTTDTATARSGH